MRALSIAALAALLVSAHVYASAADLSLGIDPMVLQFTAPYGGHARASVTVTNAGSSDELVYARPVDWRTSEDGDVVFERAGAERAHSLTGSLSLSPQSFVLHAGETRSIQVYLQMPASGQQGALWGGFILRAASSGAGTAAAVPGGTILVYDTAGSPRRHVKLTGLRITSKAAHAHLIAGVLNDGETYVRPLVRVIVQQGETTVLDRDLPCSVIFAGAKRRIDAPLDALPPGTYRVHFLLNYGGDAMLDGVTHATIR